jgi:hypothetical protein
MRDTGGVILMLGSSPLFRHARESGHPGAADSIPATLDPAFAGATTKRNWEPYVRFTPRPSRTRRQAIAIRARAAAGSLTSQAGRGQGEGPSLSAPKIVFLSPHDSVIRGETALEAPATECLRLKNVGGVSGILDSTL